MTSSVGVAVAPGWLVFGLRFAPPRTASGARRRQQHEPATTGACFFYGTRPSSEPASVLESHVSNWSSDHPDRVTSSS